MLIIRASSLGHIMSDAKSIDPALLDPETLAITKKKVKTDKEKAILQPLLDKTLSAGAKTFIEDLARQFVYQYEPVISSKAMEKGQIVEGQSIELYNSVFFTDHAKNAERKTNGLITGEADIVDADTKTIKDIKSSWSLATFPATKAAGMDSLYEWQLRAYMLLWDFQKAELAYCMVSTPEELIGYEDEGVHIVDHIDPGLRVTRIPFIRCPIKDALITTKVKAAQQYFELAIEQINEDHI